MHFWKNGDIMNIYSIYWVDDVVEIFPILESARSLLDEQMYFILLLF